MTLISARQDPARGGFSAQFSCIPKFEAAVLPAFLTPDECEDIIRHGHSLGLRRARLAGGLEAQAIRSAESCWLDDDSLPWLTTRMIRAVSRLTQDSFPFDLEGFDEGFHLLRYEGAPGGLSGDFYDWHIDIGASGATITRKLSLVLQLSNPLDYDGGRLEVNMGGDIVAQPAEQGALIAFPSFALHRVTPVLSGVRHSLAMWVHGPAFR